MPHHPAIQQALQVVLHHTLTAIHQYFLHARILKHGGWMPHADEAYRHSVQAMKHADMLVEHCLSLGGMPQLKPLEPCVAQQPEAIVEADIACQAMLLAAVDVALELAKTHHDASTAKLLAVVRSACEEHGVWLRAEQKRLCTAAA